MAFITSSTRSVFLLRVRGVTVPVYEVIMRSSLPLREPLSFVNPVDDHPPVLFPQVPWREKQITSDLKNRSTFGLVTGGNPRHPVSSGTDEVTLPQTEWATLAGHFCACSLRST